MGDQQGIKQISASNSGEKASLARSMVKIKIQIVVQADDPSRKEISGDGGLGMIPMCGLFGEDETSFVD